MTNEEIDAIVAAALGTTTQTETVNNEPEVQSAAPEVEYIPECDAPGELPQEYDTRVHTARFSGASWQDIITNMTFTICGAGGIGSWASLIIARFDPRTVSIFDDDIVEAVNMAGQLYKTTDIGAYKVDAVIHTIQHFTDRYFNGFRERVDAATHLGYDVTLCGFDNMEARKVAYQAWCRSAGPDALFMDVRMSADAIQIFTFTRDDKAAMQKYEDEWLFSDQEADATSCSFKQTTYVAALCSGFIGNLIVQYAQSKIGIPMTFKTEYDANTMTLKQEC